MIEMFGIARVVARVAGAVGGGGGGGGGAGGGGGRDINKYSSRLHDAAK